MQISSINSAAGTHAAHQPPSASALANRIFKNADSDNDGSITQTQLEDALKDAPQSPDGKQGPDAATLFAEADKNGDGMITKKDLTAALSKNKENAGTDGPRRGAGGPPPPRDGQAPAASGGVSSTAKSTTETNEVYENADTNKDGTVTTLEQADYDRTHPADVNLEDQIKSLASDTRTGVHLDTEA